MIKKMTNLIAYGAAVLACNSLLAVSTDIKVFHSDTMNKDINYRVVLPNSYTGRESDPDKIFPVLYCLHGANSNEEPWSVMLPLNNAIDGEYPAIIVTFYAENSSYIDDPADPQTQYTTFFFDELVPFIESTYRAGRKPGLRAVTGFSMGGYGAWHYMLEKPDFFSSVSALSGAFDRNPRGQSQWNPFNQIPQMAAEKVVLPPTYMNCGSLDSSWLDHSVRMEKILTDNGYTTTFIETPNAGHNWTFWRDTSDEIIKFHYQYFSDSETWRGLEVTGTNVETSSIGWIDILKDPWIWSFSLGSWIYLSNQWTPQNSGWVYVSSL